jgi:hypothetical protein
MKKAMKWLVISIFISSFVGFAVAQPIFPRDNPTPPGSGCKNTLTRYTPGC